jgi:lysophospholipase L1-like esterase
MPLSRRSLLVAAFAVAAGCSSDRTAGSPSTVVTPLAAAPPEASIPAIRQATVRSLAMVGDSITFRSKPALTQVFAAQGIGDVAIDAAVSRRIAVGNGKREPLNGEKVLSNMIAFGIRPDVFVIALGTNDAGVADPGSFAQLIDTMLAMPPASTPVVWIDVYRPANLDQTKLFNEVLRQRAAARPYTTVASWFDLASDRGRKLLSSDNLHPNEAGQSAFAALVGNAVAAVS